MIINTQNRRGPGVADTVAAAAQTGHGCVVG